VLLVKLVELTAQFVVQLLALLVPPLVFSKILPTLLIAKLVQLIAMLVLVMLNVILMDVPPVTPSWLLAKIVL